MIKLNELLENAVKNEASDIFIISGSPIKEKTDGHIHQLNDEKLFPDDTKSLISEIYASANRSMDKFIQTGDDDFSFSVPSLARFRVNTYKQRNSMAAVIRIVSFDIPDYKELGIPDEVMNIADTTGGMILFTGTAGSGKSTTQACIIDRINKTRDCHIVTLEDPIEYLHRHQKSIVSQREISIDTQDYLSALRACLRQSPDVILLGEMRDAQTIQTALTAAETGHAIIATLHTKGAVHAIDRIIDAFPSVQQPQIRTQLSLVLKTVISQQLIPDTKGELIPAYGIMHVNNAIRNLIRDNKNHQIENSILSSSGEGMITMDQYLLKLYKKGQITKDVLLQYSDNSEQIKRNI